MKKTLSFILAVVMLLSMMTGLNFTAYAAESITSVEVKNVPAPVIGKTIDDISFCTISDNVGYTYFKTTDSILWFDLDSSNPSAVLSKDTVCLKGHRYKASVRFIIKSGFRFADSVSATLNGKAATVAQYLGRSLSTNIAVEYTFPALDYNYIYSVALAAEAISKGTVLTNDNFIANTAGVQKQAVCTYTRNGEDISLGETVTFGDYGAKVWIAPENNYRFANNVVVKFGNNVFTEIARIGQAICVQSADNLWSIACTHSVYSDYEYDATNHWKSCTSCGEKSNFGEHKFTSKTDGDTTTYTCSTCGFKKVDKYKQDNFRYADVPGGVEIISYYGADTNVIIPSTLGGKKVVSLGEYAFSKEQGSYKKTNLKSVTIPSSVNTLGQGVFNGCSALTSVTIPAGVKRIESEAFINCSALANIAIPYGVEFIGASAFQGCSALANIVLPCSVKTLKAYAFRECTSLVNIVIPDSVTTMGGYVFLACTSLKSAEVGSGITEIPESTFSDCSALESVIIPESIKTVNRYAFDKTALTTVYYRGSSSAEYDDIQVKLSSSNTKFIAASVVANYNVKADIGQHKYSQVITTAPTCVDEGYTLNVCEGCGDSFKTDAVPATGVHTYSAASYVSEPTCTDAGNYIQICKVCGKEQTGSTPKLGHDYSSALTAPTCTEKGFTTYTCSRCGDVYKDNYTNALGHDYKETVVAPTCSTKGYTAKACSRCDDKQIVNETEMIAHDSKVTNVVNPTDTKAGYTEHKCSMCGAVIKTDNYTAPTGKVKGFKCKTRKTNEETLTWTKISGIKGYQVQWSTDGKKWKEIVQSSTKTSVTVKKLKTATSYKARIRFIVSTPEGNKYSPWTTLTTPTAPTGTTLNSVKAGKTSFTANWKKNKSVSGYQVQYSLKKDFSDAKTVKVKKAGTLKTTVKKLKGNKTYYVKVRTYKTISKVDCYSAWSKTKTVKVKK